MPTIAIADVVVQDRLRKFTDESVESLASSIERLTLFHPIVINKDGNILLAGERRLEACKLLGWERIECKFKEDLTEDEALEIELEENLQREDISWQEESVARERLHEIKIRLYGKPRHSKDPGWRLQDTADSLGISKVQVHRDLQLAQALKSNIGGTIAKIKTKEKALRVLKNLAEREIHKEIAKAEMLKRAEAVEAGEEDSLAGISLLHGDCTEILPHIPSDSVDLVICDPPYGIGDEYIITGDKGLKFDNDPEDNLMLYVKVIPHLYRTLKPATHCYIFFAIQFYQPIRDLCEKAGFEVRLMPLIWVKESGGMTDMDWRFPPSYESILFMSKPPGRPLGKQVNRDTFIIPREHASKRIHPMERPRALIQEFVEISSNPGDLILDPFSGSFVVPDIAMINERRCIAIELNDDHYNAGQTRLGLVARQQEAAENEGQEDKED